MDIQHLQRNTEGKDYIIGDLHGCYDLLLQALHEISFDPSTDRLICTGDLADRGPQSAQCLSLLNKPWFYSVLGNHDAMLLGTCESLSENVFRTKETIPEWETSSLFIPVNGADWFIDQYMEDAHFCETVGRALARLPNLIVLETQAGRKYVCHAELDVTINLRAAPFLVTDEWLDTLLHTPEDLRQHLFPVPNYLQHIRWFRQFGSLANRGERNFKLQRHAQLGTIFAGHTVVPKPTRLAGYYFIDTQAYQTGTLTLMEACSEQVNLVQFDAFSPRLKL